MNDSSERLDEVIRLLRDGRFDKAAPMLEQMRRDGVQSPVIDYGLGLVDFARGRLESASGYFHNVIRQQYDHANAHFYLGQIARQENDEQRAQHFFKLTLQLQPDHAGARRELPGGDDPGGTSSANTAAAGSAMTDFTIPRNDAELEEYKKRRVKKEQANFWIENWHSVPWPVRAIQVIAVVLAVLAFVGVFGFLLLKALG